MIRALLFLSLLIAASTTHAACAARLLVQNARLISPWLAVELARGGQLQESIDIRVTDTQDCPALVLGAEVLVPPDSRARASARAAPNGAQLGSEPGAGQPLLALPDATAGDISIDPVIEWSAQGQALAAGRQELSVRWRLYDADELLPQPLIEVESVLIADVPAVLEVELIAAGNRQPLAGGTAMLDFGEVSSAAARDVDIEVRGNASVQLSVSRNWGELRLRGRVDYTIPYTLLLDGRALADGEPQSLRASGDLSRARLSVQLGEVERRAAGVYEDTLTVIVAPE
jgi:hypothetical protein